ncbi:MAG: hypothetical protein ACK55I_29075, partial [bacterium]
MAWSLGSLARTELHFQVDYAGAKQSKWCGCQQCVGHPQLPERIHQPQRKERHKNRDRKGADQRPCQASEKEHVLEWKVWGLSHGHGLRGDSRSVV